MPRRIMPMHPAMAGAGLLSMLPIIGPLAGMLGLGRKRKTRGSGKRKATGSGRRRTRK